MGVLLSKPSSCHNTELLSYGGECLWVLGNNDDCLLDGAASDIGGPVEQLPRVELPCAAYAEERTFGCAFEYQGEARKVLCSTALLLVSWLL